MPYRFLTPLVIGCLLHALPAAPLAAQGAGNGNVAAVELIAAGDRESVARRTARALEQYEAAIARDPLSASAHWKASREAVDLGEAEDNDRLRSGLYARAVTLARTALELAPLEAEAHFHLARALGRSALDAGPRDRVRLAGDVRLHAIRAIELDARHAGALHVLGVWHAEVMRLNPIARGMARAFLGGQVLGTASWAEAARLLEQAVAIAPERMVHRLDLARIYRDMGRKADARREYAAAIASELLDANDERYRRAAAGELRALK